MIAAPHEQTVQQVGSTGASPLVDALSSLLAPRTLDTSASPDEAHAEPDALHRLLARFQTGGYADLIESWIGTGANRHIEPHQLGQALGEQKVDKLTRQTGVPRPTLLDELARLLPTVIDPLPHKAGCLRSHLRRRDVEEADRARCLWQRRRASGHRRVPRGSSVKLNYEPKLRAFSYLALHWAFD